MKRNAAFTFVQMMILVVIVLIAIVMLTVVISRKRAQSNIASMNAISHIRIITQGMIIYAQGNNLLFPGLASDGSIDPAVGLTAQSRISVLIEQNYFTVEYARSPMEVQTQTTSYALLQVNVDTDGKTVPKDGRNAEWRDNNNSQSVVISDRAIPIAGSFTNFKSIHTDPKPGNTDWRGSVGWNDGHVSFETSHILPTKYGKTSHLLDDLFATPGDAHSGDEAFMVWSGTNEL